MCVCVCVCVLTIVVWRAWRKLCPKETPIKLGKIWTDKYQSFWSLTNDLQQIKKNLLNKIIKTQ